MKRLLILCLCCLGLASCEIVSDYAPDYDINNDDPFYRTQWHVTEHNGSWLRDQNSMILDFDIYSNKELTIYAKEDIITPGEVFFSSESYSTERVSEVTWVIQNYRYKGTLHDVVLVWRYGTTLNISIYDQDDNIVDIFEASKNNSIIDLATVAK